jgi:hypothetical protein
MIPSTATSADLAAPFFSIYNGGMEHNAWLKIFAVKGQEGGMQLGRLFSFLDLKDHWLICASLAYDPYSANNSNPAYQL